MNVSAEIFPRGSARNIITGWYRERFTGTPAAGQDKNPPPETEYAGSGGHPAPHRKTDQGAPAVRPGYILIGCIGILLLAVMPVQAFTAQDLTITLDANGNAHADMQYELSLAEQAAVFFHAADPATTLQNALQDNLGRQVTVVKADASSAEVIIPSFAAVVSNSTKTTVTTPAFSFENAQAAVRNQWYASLISADFAPDTTVITFPDGYTSTYYSRISIPSVTHTLA